MSVLIKGMKMPKDCPQCPLSHWNKIDQLTGCELVRRYVPESESSYWQSDTRPEWCPLVELPDHGDLMDRDKFVAEKREQFCADCSKRKSLKTGRFVYEIGDCVCRACDINDMLDYIEDAPVVIPAERSEDAQKAD